MSTAGPAAAGAPPPVDEAALVASLAGWAAQQRWFPAKGRESRLSLRGAATLAATPDAVVRLLVVAVRDAAGAAAEQLVQVPVVHRRTDDAAGGPPAGAVTAVTGTDGGRWTVVDGPSDPAYVAALLGLLGDGGAGPDGATSARGHLTPGATAPDPAAPSRVLAGEQSNTSIIVTPQQGPPVIVKVFRTLSPGDNPDVVVQGALAAAGCSRIPSPVGWVQGTWPGGGGERVAGHLAVAAEFVEGAQDAWREALAAVTAGRAFAEEARELGAATGEVHRALAAALPTRRASPADAAALADDLRRRAAWALGAAPVLAPFEAALQRRLDEAPSLLDGEDALLQQVHGDYHLGQVLHAPARGWLLLDFEGEPLRPLAERTRPDLALRDVAGMLRSLDYAAGSAERSGVGPAAARAWAQEARDAFCQGYAAASGSDPRASAHLLDALELDKALYEVVYETQNRPPWVPVPLAAVRRLIGS